MATSGSVPAPGRGGSELRPDALIADGPSRGGPAHLPTFLIPVRSGRGSARLTVELQWRYSAEPLSRRASTRAQEERQFRTRVRSIRKTRPLRLDRLHTMGRTAESPIGSRACTHALDRGAF